VKVLIIGGSGLLGTFAVQESLARGHEVTALARTARQPASGVRWIAGDITRMTEVELADACRGQDAVVYALGIDDRAPHARPSYPVFFDDHVTVCTRVGRGAREVGVKKLVVYGSYFTHFDHTLPSLELAKHHPYVRSRCAQRDAVLALARPGFQAYVLELPYIIGSLPKNVPPWTFLFSMLAGPVTMFFTRGGTAALTARQVAQASLGAIEGSAPGAAYALGGVKLDLARVGAPLLRRRRLHQTRVESAQRRVRGLRGDLGLVPRAARPRARARHRALREAAVFERLRRPRAGPTRSWVWPRRLRRRDEDAGHGVAGDFTLTLTSPASFPTHERV
jgi:dihydroflavonol-4-reductase